MLIGKQVQKPIAYVFGSGDGRMADPVACLVQVVNWAAYAGMTGYRDQAVDYYLDCAAMMRIWDASESI